jgi:UDP-glucuronate 4-epimerase
MAIARFVDAMHRGEEIPVSGDGSSARDYTFVDDIIAGVRAAMERFDGYRVYNLGNSAPVTLAELVQRIEAAVGRPARVRRVPFYAGDVEATWAAPENARRDLGFSASVPLDEGLRRVVEWYRQEGARFHDLGRLVP